MFKRQMPVGWICRTWMQTPENGWCSEFDRFDSREEAEEHGKWHVDNINEEEMARDYEVYQDFTDPF